MAAIRVAQLARGIVVFGEEEGGVIPLSRVFVKQLIHRPQKPFGLLPSRRALAAQSCLQIRHEQSRPHTFARNVRYDKPEPSLAEIKKVVIVPANGPGGTANPRVDKRLNQRLADRKS